MSSHIRLHHDLHGYSVISCCNSTGFFILYTSCKSKEPCILADAVWTANVSWFPCVCVMSHSDMCSTRNLSVLRSVVNTKKKCECYLLLWSSILSLPCEPGLTTNCSSFFWFIFLLRIHVQACWCFALVPSIRSPLLLLMLVSVASCTSPLCFRQCTHNVRLLLTFDTSVHECVSCIIWLS